MYGGYTAEGIDWNTDISQAVDRFPEYARDGTVLGSKRLADGTTQSIVWLISSTLFSVIVLISLATLPEAEQPDHKLQYWWAVVKYVLLLAAILAMLGIWKTIQVLQWLFWMVFPDNYQLQVCKDAGWQLQGSRGLDDNGKQYYGFLQENGDAVTNPLTLPVSVFPVDSRFAGGNGIERYFYVSTRLWNLIVLPIVLIVCGYAAFFYEEEHIFGFKLDAGSDFDANTDEGDARLKRLFAEAAAAGIERKSMASLNNDTLLETILEKAGIERAGDRLMIILAIRDSGSETAEVTTAEPPRTVQPTTMNSTSAVNPRQQQQQDSPSQTWALPPVPPPNQPAPAASPPQQTCQAIAAYTATADNQVSLAQGETLTILDDAGLWWRLRKASGKEGLAPSNYIAKNAGAVVLPPVPSTTGLSEA